MKKIMMAVAIVSAAVAANAATVNWNSGIIYVASDAAGTTGSGTSYKAGLESSGRMVTAYLYEFETEAAYTAAQSASVESLYADYVKAGVATTGTKTTIGNGQANIAQTVTDASGMHYGMIIYTDTANVNLGSNEAFVKVSFGSANVEGSTAKSLANMALTSGGATSANWTAIGGSTPEPIPEPTSGLLMLLGLAGLALKRKRA